MTTYIRDKINIQKLISLIKFQNNELNAKVAYLATILNTEKKMTGDFENLVKQIIFQITRMLQSTDSDDVIEGTQMLLNLVRDGDDIDSQTGNRSICMHTCEIGTDEILAKILEQNVQRYLDILRKSDKPKEETKSLEASLHSIISLANPLVDKESGVSDVTGQFDSCKEITINVLKIVQFLIAAHTSCLKRVINAHIPSQLFKLIDKTVGDRVRLHACECLRLMSRAKKIMKIQIIEEDHDLETLFKGLITDPNPEVMKKGLTIICNFSIDFPGMVIGFNNFMPRMKEFIFQDINLDIKYFAVKTLKNLLFAGHICDVKRDAEKLIFEEIDINDICKLLDDQDPRVVEQAKLIFRNLNYMTEKEEMQAKEDQNKPILDRISDQHTRERILEMIKDAQTVE